MLLGGQFFDFQATHCALSVVVLLRPFDLWIYEKHRSGKYKPVPLQGCLPREAIDSVKKPPKLRLCQVR